MSTLNTNLTVISGRLAKDPSLVYTQSGMACTSLTVAVGDGQDKQGNDRTQFIQVSVWGKQAEAVANNLAKGSQVIVNGKLIVRSYTSKKYVDQSGQPAVIYQTSVMANHVEFTSSKADNQRFVANSSAAKQNQPVQNGGFQQQAPQQTTGFKKAPAAPKATGFQPQQNQQQNANQQAPAAPFDGGVVVSDDDLPF